MQNKVPVLKCMRDFAPAHQVTLVCELLALSTRRFSCAEWLVAAGWLSNADIILEGNPVLDACIRLFSETIELRGHSSFVKNTVCKLVDVRMPMELTDAVLTFDPKPYLEKRYGDVADRELDAVSLEFMVSLRSSVAQFMSSMPNKKGAPEWLVDLKLHMKTVLKPQPAIGGTGALPITDVTGVTTAAAPCPPHTAADATAGAGVAGATTSDGAAAVAPSPAVGGTGPAVGGEGPTVGGTAPSEVHAVGGTPVIASAGPPETSGGRSEAILPSGGVQVGWVVVGSSGRNKESFDNKRCRVTSILRREYRVEILEGPATGQTHKYKHDMVSVTPQSAEHVAAPDESAESDATIAADGLLEEAKAAATKAAATAADNQEDILSIWGEGEF